MLLKHLKNGLAKQNPTHFFRRSIFSTSNRASAKASSENVEKKEQKSVESRRPLTEDEIQKIINLDNIHVVTKFQHKLPQRPPLIKNFFIGKIDTELLTYPEVMEVKEFNGLVEDVRPVTNYFVNNVCATEPDLRFRDVSNQMIADFQRLKLFGASVHQRFGGQGLFKSELNYAIEAEANDMKSFSVLAGHRLAVEAISDHGNVSHHSQFLMDMAKGEIIGAVCLPDLLNTNDPKKLTISKTSDGDYVLNGSRSFAICSQHANVLVVVAEKSGELKQEYEIDEDDDTEDDDYFDAYMTVVLDPKSSGITMIDEAETIGCKDVPFKTINFSNVRIQKDPILSEGFDDRKISQKLIASSRLYESTLNMIQAKNLLNQLIEFSVESSWNSEKMRDLVYVRNHLAKVACEIYGLESMIYLTTGIIDRFDNPKVELECAATKVYSQEILRNLSEIATDVIGSPATISGHSIGLEITNATQLQFGERGLKSYIGQTGLRHALDFFGDRVSSYQDSIWTKMGITDFQPVEHIKDTFYLGEFLHPTLTELATELEYSILRLQCCAEMLLSRYRESVTERQTEIEQFGEIVIQNYAMFASLARASRAYCVGLRYSVFETVAAGCLTENYTRNILKQALDIKYNRNGIQGLDHTIVNNLLKRHRNQSIVIPSVLHSRVIQKHVK